MDLGIKDRKAIVCASSKGLGKACAKALMQEGVTVVINARNDEKLTETYKELAKIDKNKISMVVADLNTEEGRDSIVRSCPDADILVNNNGGPPPINFIDSDKDAWLKALESNSINEEIRRNKNKGATNNTAFNFQRVLYHSQVDRGRLLVDAVASGSEMNFSGNPSGVNPETGGSIFDEPATYITSIGLYNHQNDLLAVAKLSKPVRKDQAITLGGQVKLDF